MPARRSSRVYTLLFLAVLAASLREAQVDPRLLFDRQSLASLHAFATRMFPPDLSRPFLSALARPALETLQISVIGTLLAMLIGWPLGFFATASLRWSGILHQQRTASGRWALGFAPWAASRALLSVFRSIPEFVWAFLFVRAVGLGPFPGVLAIGVAYGGTLGKVYSEILESVDERPLEALHSAGAGPLAVALYGVLPQALPNLVSYTLYRWECAIRASAILGFVGAGGLGQQLELSMRMFQFDQVLTIVGILFLLVAAVDFVSGRIRAQVAR
jgi:phosphonate transport system permease protein